MGMVVIGGFLVAGTYYLVNNVVIPSLPSNQVRPLAAPARVT